MLVKLLKLEGVKDAIAACRVCYGSFDIDDYDNNNTEKDFKLLSKVMSSGHLSVAEHVTASFYVEGISRACSHQLVRHRIASFCLSGDTEVVAFRSVKGRSQKKWTMRKLWEMSQTSHGRSRLKLIRLRSMDENGVLVPGKIKSVIDSGRQDVLRITTRCGRVVKATAKHRIHTPEGWKQAGDLAVGNKITANGLPAHKNAEWIEEMYLNRNMERKDVAELAGVSDACLGQWIRRFRLQKPKGKYPGRQPGYGKPGMFSDETKALLGDKKRGEKNQKIQK